MKHEPPLLEQVRIGTPLPRTLFMDTYSPFLSRLLLMLDFTASETENILAVFERKIFGESECFVYDTSRGKFPQFMYEILKQSLAEIPYKKELTPELWKNEWKKHVLDQALMKLRQEEKTNEYAAFEAHVLDGKSAKETAVMDNVREIAHIFRKGT